jgi:hypothetical protein
MPALHALYSKMLAERTASRNVLHSFILFYFIYLCTRTRDRAHARSVVPSYCINPGDLIL